MQTGVSQQIAFCIYADSILHMQIVCCIYADSMLCTQIVCCIYADSNLCMQIITCMDMEYNLWSLWSLWQHISLFKMKIYQKFQLKNLYGLNSPVVTFSAYRCTKMAALEVLLWPHYERKYFYEMSHQFSFSGRVQKCCQTLTAAILRCLKLRSNLAYFQKNRKTTKSTYFKTLAIRKQELWHPSWIK